MKKRKLGGGTIIALAASLTAGLVATGCGEHKHTYQSEVTDPTCTEQGFTTYTCTDGDDSYVDDYVPALGHEYGAWQTLTEATCSAPEVQIRYCKHDNTHFETQTVGEPDEDSHEWGEWEPYVDATCVDEALEIRYCKNDKDHYEIRSVGSPDDDSHDWGEWKTFTAATCVSAEIQIRYCLSDETHYEKRTHGEPDPTAHEWGEWETQTEPTCEEKGVAIRYCEHDEEHYETKDIDPIDHDWGEWETDTPATCEKPEVQIRYCKNDEDHFETKEVGEPLGHDWGEWKTLTEATCSSPEVQIRYCKTDESHFETKKVGEPLAHSFGSNHICSECGAFDLAWIERSASATVSIHDPSILRAYTDQYGNIYPTLPEDEDIEVRDIYFLFGTHRGCAVSLDMEKWVTFSLTFYAEGTTTLSTSDAAIFKSANEWSNNGNSISGNIWAPDILWNPVLEKWCVYYTMNSGANDWRCSIFLMTSDNIAGPYVFEDFVVFSGMNNQKGGAGNDEYKKVTGEDTIPDRYFYDGGTLMDTWQGTYGSSCIDANVLYDEDGELWMFYGSWSGGIFLIKLDNETGLRDYSYDYGYTADDYKEDGAVWESASLVYDPYMGIHVAGGYYVSGEGPYVKYIDGYYYLFVTYGYLDSVGGYNMRVYRSESITGKYVDATGDWAVFSSFTLNYGANMKYGISYMQNYIWSWWSAGKGEVSQGHNSVYVDDDGRIFLIYHTRFNDGSEGHNVRVHELVLNEDGWLLVAPFRKSATDKIVTDATAEDLAGRWGVLVHSNVDYLTRETNTDQALFVNADGTLSGLYTGTWSLNGSNITLVTNNGTFKGVVMEQYMDGANISEFDNVVYTFTAMNENELCIWGVMYPDGSYFIEDIYDSLTLPGELIESVVFPTSAAWGTLISYESSNPDVLTATGEVIAPEENTEVTITATIVCGEETRTKTFTVNVISLPSYLGNFPEAIDTDIVLNIYGEIGAGGNVSANDYINANTGVAISFTLSNYTNANTIVLASADGAYSIALGRLSYTTTVNNTTRTSTLNASNTGAFLCANDSCLVTISFNIDGSISFYRDGELQFTYAASTKIGNGNTASTVATLSKLIISQMGLVGVPVSSGISNVIITYAADFDAETYEAPAEASKDTIAVIGGTDDEAELGEWFVAEDVSGNFKYTYSFRVEADLTEETANNNWYVKVGNWVLGANGISLNAANELAEINSGVTYQIPYDLATYLSMYGKADIRLVVERSGSIATVTATIKPRTAGFYGAITYSASYEVGDEDLTVALGGKACYIEVYSAYITATGALEKGGAEFHLSETISLETGLSFSFWLDSSATAGDWTVLLDADGYIITYGNIEVFNSEMGENGTYTHNSYPSNTANDTANKYWNSMLVADPAYFTINITVEKGIEIYRNGIRYIWYNSATDKLNTLSGDMDLNVKQFVTTLLNNAIEGGFTFDTVETDSNFSDITIGTALSEKDAADLYVSVSD